MKPKTLIERCKELYGPQWQTSFARDCGRDRTTVQRWALGKFNIPGDIQATLDTLIAKKIKRLQKLQNE